MAADDATGAPRPPVVLRIKLRYDDTDAMIARFAPNVGKTGLFLPTKSLQPVGTEVKFELRLANDTPVLVGLGKVKATQAFDEAKPRAVFGMAVELMRVTKESRELIMKMLERRKQLGLADVALPLPADLEAARRPDEPRQSDVVTPVPGAPPLPPILTAPMTEVTEPLMTAPRRTTGSIAIAKPAAGPTALAAEAPRKRRVPVEEIIERASGPIASVQVIVPGLDGDVDLPAALARARMLSVGELDVELAAVRDSDATPRAIDVESASAELARQLGGRPVRRADRSARWAPPPIVIAPPPLPPLPPPPPAASADDGWGTDEDASPSLPEPVVEAVVEATPEAVPEPLRSPSISDDVQQLDDDDVEELEPTTIGMMPPASGPPVGHVRLITEPSLEIDDSQIVEEAGSETSVGMEPAPELGLPDAEAGDEPAPPPLAAKASREPKPHERPSFVDFASRLALDDDEHDPTPLPPPTPADDAIAALEREEEAEFGEVHGDVDPRQLSAGYALAQFEDHLTPLPGDLYERDRRASTPPPPPPGRQKHPTSPGYASAELDLENALEALDVDLDDLAIPIDEAPEPHASTDLARVGSPRGRVSIRPPRVSDESPESSKSGFIDLDELDDSDEAK